MELEVITLEDGNEYAVLQEIDNYLYLVNTENEAEFCIRKNVVRDGQEYIESLDSDEEFNHALDLFAKANNNQ